jgi:hypothetical protein
MRFEMAITLPVSGQTNWDVPLNAALTDLDGDVTAINNVIEAVPELETRTAGETWYRLVAASTASANVKAKADFVCMGTGDQVQIQAAVDAAFAEGGGTVKLSAGSFNLSAPITLHPTVTLWGHHGDQIFNPNQLTVGSYLKPQSPFTGGAAIVLLGQTAGAYANKSAEQRIFNLTIDGSNSAAAVHGIQASDYIHGVVLRDVCVKQVTGKGIYTFTENSAQPFSWTFNRVVVDNATDVGIHLINHSDCTMVDVISIGSGGNNYTLSNMPNSRLIGCRAEWSDAHGFHITGNYGTGQGSGGIVLAGCSTDRNGFNGVFVDATGNAPVILEGMIVRRDGRNNNVGGGGYAGINVNAATAPVLVGDLACYPGVDDNGTGVNSPQYGLSVTGSTLVQYDNVYLHANTAGLNDGGGNTYLRGGANVSLASGATNAPVRTFGTMSGFLQTTGGTMTGTLNNTGALVSTVMYGALVTGDTNDRFRIRADGQVEWGSGAAVGDVTISRPSTAQVRVTPVANASSSTSVGGAVNVTNSASTGAGVVVYSTQASPTGHLVVARANNATFNQQAIYAEYVGTSHAVNVVHQGTGAASSAVNASSTNAAASAMAVAGAETGKGTVFISHTGTGADAAASALSIDLAGSGTASQGIFVTSSAGGTTGTLLHLRNGGTGALVEVTAAGALKFGSGTGATDSTISRTGANALQTLGNFTVGGYLAINAGQSDGQWTLWSGTKNVLNIGTAGGGVAIKEGTNARSGVSTLVAGTVVVANTSVTATTRIQLTSQADGGTPGWLRVSARTAATSFTITSSSGTDTSTVAWLLIEPA